MELLANKKVKEIAMSAMIRRVGNCSLREQEHDYGIHGCKCNLENLGQISYWHRNPVKNFLVNLLRTIKEY